MKDDEEEWKMLIIKNLFLHKRIKCEQIANGVFDFLDRLFSTYDIAQPLKLQVWLIKKTLQHFFCKVEDALFWHCMSWPQPSLFLGKWFHFFNWKSIVWPLVENGGTKSVEIFWVWKIFIYILKNIRFKKYFYRQIRCNFESCLFFYKINDWYHSYAGFSKWVSV